MTARPYLKLGGSELVELFDSCNGAQNILRSLREELDHRHTPTMRALRDKVNKALAKASDYVANPSQPTTAGSAVQSELPVPSAAHSETKGRTPAGSVIPTRFKPEANSTRPDVSPVDEELTTGPVRGQLGSIRACGVLRGVPSRWSFPAKREFEIEVPNNATRVEKFVAALRALVKDMRRRGSGMRTVALEHGEAVPLDGRERGYRFPYDGEAELFEGAKVAITFGSRTCDGRIVSVTSKWLIVSFDEDLGRTIGSCVLRIDNTAMIDALADRLDKVRSGDAKLNLSLAEDVLDNSGDHVAGAIVQDAPN